MRKYGIFSSAQYSARGGKKYRSYIFLFLSEVLLFGHLDSNFAMEFVIL